MNRAARSTIERIRGHGYRVLFMCNYDASISVTAISPSGEAYIVHGKLCDDSRLIAELARIVGVPAAAPVPNAGTHPMQAD